MTSNIISQQPQIPADTIQIHNNKITTSSRKVAELFGKQHKNVIQKIENLECSPEFTSANFSAHVEKIKAGAVTRDSKVYEITKDGFIFLATRFTGKKAAKVTEDYIAEFNRMADELNNRQIATLEQNHALALKAQQEILHDSPWRPMEQIHISEDELQKYQMLNKMAATLELRGDPVILPAQILANLALPISGMLDHIKSINELENITRHRVNEVFTAADRNSSVFMRQN